MEQKRVLNTSAIKGTVLKVVLWFIAMCVITKFFGECIGQFATVFSVAIVAPCMMIYDRTAHYEIMETLALWFMFAILIGAFIEMQGLYMILPAWW